MVRRLNTLPTDSPSGGVAPRGGLGERRGRWAARLRAVTGAVLALGSEQPRILVIDDDTEILASLKDNLRKEGFVRVRTARDGEKAIDTAYLHPPDVVVLDHRVPGMDAEAVANTMKMLAPGARVIAYSGVAREAPPWADAHALTPDLVPLVCTIAETV